MQEVVLKGIIAAAQIRATGMAAQNSLDTAQGRYPSYDAGEFETQAVIVEEAVEKYFNSAVERG